MGTGMFDFLSNHANTIYLLTLLSITTFVASLIFIPFLVIRIPKNYFTDAYRHESRLRHLHPAVYYSLITMKNLLGLVIFIAGILMLVLPGQGVLSMLVGLSLTDFPGKYRVERWLVKKPAVLHSINWIRRKARQPDLLPPDT